MTVLALLFLLHLVFDLLTIWSPVALRYLAAWCIARAAGMDAARETAHRTKVSEQFRLGLESANRQSFGRYSSASGSGRSGRMSGLNLTGDLGHAPAELTELTAPNIDDR